jgi:hypothetical protein
MADGDTDTQLLALHASGASVPAIARELGRPERWVYRQFDRLRLERPSARAEPSEPLDSFIRVRCTKSQADDFKTRAREAGVSESELARSLLWPAG